MFIFSIGNFNGTLSKIPASDLGAITIKEVLQRGNTKPEEINEVILGQVRNFKMTFMS